MASLDSRGFIGRIYVRGLIGRNYVGDHYTLLHTKYICSGPHGFREEDFFPHFKSKGVNDPRGLASLGSRGLIGRIM